MGITDSYNRKINYLRVSVTDRCNMRCAYCMPPEGIQLIPHQEVLHYGEIREIVKAGALLGIKSIRLTGGEPTIRKDLSRLVTMLKEIEGIDFVYFDKNDVVRHRLVREIIDAYGKYGEKDFGKGK